MRLANCAFVASSIGSGAKQKYSSQKAIGGASAHAIKMNGWALRHFLRANRPSSPW